MRETQSSNSFHRGAITAFTLTLLTAACSSGGGGGGAALITESEPNDAFGTADVVPIGTPVQGDVTTIGDIDYFQFSLTQDQIIRIEISASRNDQTTWDTADNIARTTLFDTDGTSSLLDHVFTPAGGWDWGKHDLDMPLFYVPATGDYYVRVAQDDPLVAGGDYVLTVKTVTLPGLVHETEAPGATGANDTDGTAEPITAGSVHGYHVAGELDYYSFTIATPTIVRFEMTAYRNGMSQGDPNYYDPTLTLFDVDGTTQLEFVDDAFFFDSAIHYRIDTAGTYYIAVDEFAGSGDAEYFLTYTTANATGTAEGASNDTFGTADALAYDGKIDGTMNTGDIDFFEFTGTAGDMVRLQVFDGDNSDLGADDVNATFLESDGVTQIPNGGDGLLQTLSTILTTTGTFYVRMDPDGSPTATPYSIHLTRFQSSTFETESNDTIATADLLTNRVAGVIDAAAAVDVFRFTGSTNQFVTISCYASNITTEAQSSDGSAEYSGHGSDLEPVIEILDGTNTVIATSFIDPVNVFTEDVVDSLPTVAVAGITNPGGTYYVRVSDANGAGGATFTYVIEKR